MNTLEVLYIFIEPLESRENNWIKLLYLIIIIFNDEYISF